MNSLTGQLYHGIKYRQGKYKNLKKRFIVKKMILIEFIFCCIDTSFVCFQDYHVMIVLYSVCLSTHRLKRKEEDKFYLLFPEKFSIKLISEKLLLIKNVWIGVDLEGVIILFS
jgi:hypothetical protein